jgi:hypothetical protein
MRRVGRLLVVGTAFAALLPSTAQGAAPNYIFVSGPGLARPVLFSDWKENLELFSAAVFSVRPDAATLRGLRNRPRLDLAHFWQWSGRPAPRTPREANQHGRFYPAHGSEPAVVLLAVDGATGYLLASPELLKFLKRHGVPVRL